MESCQIKHSLPLSHLIILFLYLFLFAPKCHALTNQKPSKNNTVSAFVVFGDSTVDPGNNNYIATAFKGNFPPYGKDFPNHIPTGRFSNGLLSSDFTASYLGVKDIVPPYLDPTLSIEELMSGVSFASAGSGFDPLTSKLSNVIAMSKQVEYFKEYKGRLENAMGKQRMEDHIKKAFFLISAGTNDFVVNYFGLPIRRKTYSLMSYQQFLLQSTIQILQDLTEEGARRIVVAGLPPMGCLPVVITLNTNYAMDKRRRCIEKYSSVAREYNLMLQNEVNLMRINLAHVGARIHYIDTYGPLTNLIQGHKNSGFEEVSSGCCGTGYLEAGILCNPKSYLCPDASKYVFWDSIHPTQRAYYDIFKSTQQIIDLITKV